MVLLRPAKLIGLRRRSRWHSLSLAATSHMGTGGKQGMLIEPARIPSIRKWSTTSWMVPLTDPSAMVITSASSARYVVSNPPAFRPTTSWNSAVIHGITRAPDEDPDQPDTALQ